MTFYHVFVSRHNWPDAKLTIASPLIKSRRNKDYFLFIPNLLDTYFVTISNDDMRGVINKFESF